MNVPSKKTVTAAEKVTSGSANTHRLSSRKATLLQQKICLRHFSPGKNPQEIAATMGIEQPLVIALLRKARAIA